jgi:cytochrome P450
MKVSELPDPFEAARLKKGLGEMDDQNDPVTMLLRLKDVRKSAHKYQTFSSAATPGRIVIPSEVAIRDIRQIPFEVDPPMHKDYRALVEAWFRRPNDPGYQAKLSELVTEVVELALSSEKIEVIREFSLRLQSRALTLLLNVPLENSKIWIDWGTHVFRSEGEALDGDKASILYDYIDREIDKAIANPGEDLYSMLLASEVDGRKLTKEEVKGVMILTFAGGRDTVINAVTNTIAYFSDHPESLVRLGNEPEIIDKAVEELVRYFAPLTQMGRVVTEDTVVCEHAIKADTRVSLCWASANRDASVFDQPNEVVLDRKMNPHVGFGFSHHNCLGATPARQILKTLIRTLADKVSTIKVLESEDNIEELGHFKRKVGFHKLVAAFS